MWDNEAHLKLLKSMPAQLSKDNLRDIQQTIDVDKFTNSQLLKRDLCGEYAPFCDNCNKSLQYPCAVSYVKMKQAEGMQVEIAAAENEIVEEPVTSENDSTTKRIRIAVAKRKR